MTAAPSPTAIRPPVLYDIDWSPVARSVMWIPAEYRQGTLDEALVTSAVSRGQPVQFVLRYPQRGVGNSERPEDVLGQMLTERAARHSRDEDAEHAEGMVIAPPFSRLEC